MKVKAGRRSIEISSPEKVLFPGSSITKEDVARYYARIGSSFIYHIGSRALTIQRFPDGIGKNGFFQQERADYFDRIVESHVLPRKDGSELEHIVCDTDACPVFLANLGAITFHMWLSRLDRPECPDRMIFDLDPPGGDFGNVVDGGLKLKNLLDRLGLPSFVMTTGSKGAHVIVPLDRKADFATVRGFAAATARLLAVANPDSFTDAQRKDERRGRLYIDVFRNGYGQTGVAPYTLRALPGAPVATPLEWREFINFSGDSSKYTINNIFHRLGQRDDPWYGMKRNGRSLNKPRRKLDRFIDGLERS